MARRVCRGRRVKCAAGSGGDGDWEAGSGLFVPDPLESETRVYKKWSDGCLGGERVSRLFAKCLEGVRRDGRRATTFRGMS